MSKKIPADAFLVVTEGVTVADAPKLEVVYKMAQIENGSHIKYTAKLATGKLSYPGKKQTFRRIEGTRYLGDIIGLEEEDLGQKLLIKMIDQGKSSYDLPTLQQIRDYLKNEISHFPREMFSIKKYRSYPVKTSAKLENLFQKAKIEQLKNNH